MVRLRTEGSYYKKMYQTRSPVGEGVISSYRCAFEKSGDPGDFTGIIAFRNMTNYSVMG